jgi:hypothetical protein
MLNAVVLVISSLVINFVLFVVKFFITLCGAFMEKMLDACFWMLAFKK